MSTTETLREQLSAGRTALEQHRWKEAFELLGAPDLSDQLTPEDLDGLGEAGWWLGRLDDAIAARERAFSGYMRAGETARAGMVAIAVAKDYFGKKASSTGSAWLKRAEKLLGDDGDSIEYGWLLRMRAVVALEGTGDFDSALIHATEALEVGQRHHDADLMAVALLDQGRALVARGQVEEGVPLMEEATVAAVSGELTPFNTGVVYCNIISSCEELADYRRAGEWSEAAKRWCERQAISGFPGMCRVYRAGIMRLRGDWLQAEREARQAYEELRSFNIGYAAEAFYEIGEVRLRLGDLGAALEAFEHANELGREPQPGMALLRLEQGDIDGARSCINRGLEEETPPLRRARLLPAQVEIAVAADDLEAASRAVDELKSIAETYSSRALQAAAHLSEGRLKLARGDVKAAREVLRRSWRAWQETEAPYEMARTRALLGQAFLAAGDTEAAQSEWRAARSTFERLGARPDLMTLSRLSGSDGGGTRVLEGSSSTVKTFMFTDIARSTSLVEAIGDDAWHQLVRWHDHALRSLFAAHQGEEVDQAGDGFFVAFSDAGSAIECAVAIQRKLAEHRQSHGFAPSVRIGLHAASATKVGGGYKGKAVHVAARIAAVAQGGQIKASLQTIEGASSRYPVSEPEPADLKGISHPIQVLSVEWR